MEQNSWEVPWLEYFLHGIAFSILLLILGFFWVIIFAILVIFGFLIGLAIGFLLFFLLVGGLNLVLSDAIWNVQVKSDWKSVLIHGFVLSITLIIAHVPSLIISYLMPSIFTTIILLIINAFLDGYIAKKIADYFEETYEETPELAEFRTI